MDTRSIPIADEAVSRFRRFNRFYTRFIGTLQEGILGSALSLAEARVLYELATQTAPNAKEIISALGLDPGYLSRILGRFEKEGFLRRMAERCFGCVSMYGDSQGGRFVIRCGHVHRDRAQSWFAAGGAVAGELPRRAGPSAEAHLGEPEQAAG